MQPAMDVGVFLAVGALDGVEHALGFCAEAPLSR